MATHSSILAWKIPRTEEPCGLQFTGSQRVGYDSSDLARVKINNAVIVSGGQKGPQSYMYTKGLSHTCTRRASVIRVHEGPQSYMYTCPFSPKPPSIQLPHGTEQGPLCWTVGPCWFSILNTAVCPRPSQTR